MQGQNYRNISNQIGIGISTVCECVRECTMTILRHMQHTYICLLTRQEGTLNMSRSEYDQTGIPGIMGTIDDTHIAIQKPIASGEDYYNRKSYYSINVQGLPSERCMQHADLSSSRGFQKTVYRHRSWLAWICGRCTHIRKLKSGTKLSRIPSAIWNYAIAYRFRCSGKPHLGRCASIYFGRLGIQEYARVCNYLKAQQMRSESICRCVKQTPWPSTIPHRECF